MLCVQIKNGFVPVSTGLPDPQIFDICGSGSYSNSYSYSYSYFYLKSTFDNCYRKVRILVLFKSPTGTF